MTKMFSFFEQLSDFFSSLSFNFEAFMDMLKLFLERFRDALHWVFALTELVPVRFSWIIPFVIMFLVFRFGQGLFKKGDG